MGRSRCRDGWSSSARDGRPEPDAGMPRPARLLGPDDWVPTGIIPNYLQTTIDLTMGGHVRDLGPVVDDVTGVVARFGLDPGPVPADRPGVV